MQTNGNASRGIGRTGEVVVKTKYDYINFEKSNESIESPREKCWVCKNTKSGDELGEVKYYKKWKQWCYFPIVQAVYSASCLKDIADFIEQLMAERKSAV